MSRKTIGLGLIIIGIVIIAGSLLADVLGLGAASGAIGWKQLLAAGIGLIVGVVGVVFALQKKKQ
jgi:predicted phage tail protein